MIWVGPAEDGARRVTAAAEEQDGEGAALHLRRPPTRLARLEETRMRERQRGGVGIVAVVVALVALALAGDAIGERGADAVGEVLGPVPDDPAQAAAQRFLDDYVDPDGRVVRRDQDGDTVSEGQAYALLLAVARDDAETFERVWSWTSQHLQREDGLLSWLWRDGEVRDPSSASDADLDTARALLLAAERFDRPAYHAEGVRMARAIRELETSVDGDLPVLVAGPWATAPPRTVNPSYFDPRAFAQLGEATGDRDWWDDLTAGGYRVVEQLRDDEAVLPPDWAQLREVGGARVVGVAGEAGSARYSYDAARLPVRFAAACDQRGRDLAASWWPVFADTPGPEIPDTYELTGEPRGENRSAVTVVAAAAAASAAGDTREMEALLEVAERQDAAAPTYYGAAWVALGRIMLTTDALGACPS